jgi:hypothetical protein
MSHPPYDLNPLGTGSFVIIPMKIVEFEDANGMKYTADVLEEMSLSPGKKIIVDKPGFLDIPDIKCEDGTRYKIKSIE